MHKTYNHTIKSQPLLGPGAEEALHGVKASPMHSCRHNQGRALATKINRQLVHNSNKWTSLVYNEPKLETNTFSNPCLIGDNEVQQLRWRDWFHSSGDKSISLIRFYLRTLDSPRFNSISHGKFNKKIFEQFINRDKSTDFVNIKMETTCKDRKENRIWTNCMEQLIKNVADNNRYLSNIKYLKTIRKAKHGIFPDKYVGKFLGKDIKEFKNPTQRKFDGITKEIITQDINF